MARIYRKHRLFAEKCIQFNMNGTKAYKAVYGEDMSDASAAANASRLLKSDKVQAYLEERFRETHMTPAELLNRYAEQARGAYSEYATAQGVDIKRLIADGKGHLIQKWSYNQSGKPILEFMDVQHALDQIGKALGLFKDQEQNVTLNIVGLEQLIEAIYGSTGNDDTQGG